MAKDASPKGKAIKPEPPTSTTMVERRKLAGDLLQSPDRTLERKLTGRHLIGGPR